MKCLDDCDNCKNETIGRFNVWDQVSPMSKPFKLWENTPLCIGEIEHYKKQSLVVEQVEEEPYDDGYHSTADIYEGFVDDYTCDECKTVVNKTAGGKIFYAGPDPDMEGRSLGYCEECFESKLINKE